MPLLVCSGVVWVSLPALSWLIFFCCIWCIGWCGPLLCLLVLANNILFAVSQWFALFPDVRSHCGKILIPSCGGTLGVLSAVLCRPFRQRLARVRLLFHIGCELFLCLQFPCSDRRTQTFVLLVASSLCLCFLAMSSFVRVVEPLFCQLDEVLQGL